MSKFWKMPLAVLAALAVPVLAAGPASAADDPVTATLDCVAGVLTGGCATAQPLTPRAGGADSGNDTAVDSAGADRGGAGDVLGSVLPGGLPSGLPGAAPGGLPGALPGALPGDLPGGLPGGPGQSPDPSSGGADTAPDGAEPAAGGLLATACAQFPELPAIPGVGSLTDVTCAQLPAVVCPPLLSHPEVPGLADLADLLLCAPPAAGTPASPTQPAAEETYYANCDDARARGAAPVHAGQPGYRPDLDSDGDGIGCEDAPGTTVVPVSATTAPVAGGTGRLAYTGFELSPVLATGAALLALGGGLLLASRRRT